MIEGEPNTVILKTHFSQKVYSDTKQTSMSLPRALVPVERCSPYSLTRSFGQLEIKKTSPEGNGTVKQVGWVSLYLLADIPPRMDNKVMFY